MMDSSASDQRYELITAKNRGAFVRGAKANYCFDSNQASRAANAMSVLLCCLIPHPQFPKAHSHTPVFVHTT